MSRGMVCSGCLLFFAVSVLDGVVSPRSLVSGAESVSHLLVCQKLQSMFTLLHLSEYRAGMSVSFPEGMVSGRPRSGLCMPIFSIEWVL